ncbi:DNA/RNA non-specific endonuclease [Saccharophagus degradans]|uniref:DNA/RNA non-specific endonuclease n=1 Tax=Saccharophagus degradans TaxID=86304 RepID=A0AAW7X8F6_9GAMM|nr:DNA/RNA non-specific endonuclease [Saccharophagus degradans]MDO6422773.1 DNA/RNA non-specific endonuclease [Saccharophagus degradans]MDO6606246.1 DNA/RNA non-specific endonuclease [Saccharophagus degradans]
MAAKPAARLGDIDTGHPPSPPTPVITGSTNVLINSRPAARKGDMLAPHHPGIRTITSGSKTVTINGKNAARVGDSVNCGGRLLMGSPTVFIGDGSGSGSGNVVISEAEHNEKWQIFEDSFNNLDAPPLSDYERQVMEADIAVKYRGEAGGIHAWQEYFASNNEAVPSPNAGQSEKLGHALAEKLRKQEALEDAASTRYQKAWLLDYARSNDDEILAKHSEFIDEQIDDPEATLALLTQARAAESKTANKVLGNLPPDEQIALKAKMEAAAKQAQETHRKGTDGTTKPVMHVNAGQKSTKKGQKGTWNPELEKLQLNTIYDVTVVHDGQPVVYSYETDHLGRVVRVQGSLALSIAETPKERDKNHRNPRTQRKYGGPVKEYDGGHLIATLFQGPAEKVNLVPQLAEQNRNGKWREMERDWSKELRAGSSIDVDIHAVYDDDGQVPVLLKVNHSINGTQQRPQKFSNK